MSTSATLKRIVERDAKRNQELVDAGYAGMGDACRAPVFEPTAEYPSPWRVVRDSFGPCTIYAANNKKVASWLTYEDAQCIIDEVN